MNYRESIDWLFSTQLFGIKLGLDGPRRLLKEFLAYPGHRTRVLHVAGTNGKGSTCAMAESVARAGGTRTGLFTSPHLIDFRERIRVSGVEIPEEECAALLTELRGICERLDPHPTFFEITLAAAMRWFRERECELIILETGMGGRLDATTAVPADVCAITPIGMDHMQWLGDTLEKIAFEKAGILVEGKPAISAPQHDGARRVLELEANERRTPLSFVPVPLRGYPIGLPGEHQAWNAALALECLHALGYPLDYETVRHGLETVRWPGRFEILECDDGKVVLDGAHNPEGAEALVRTWKERFGERKAALIFSAVESKDVAGIARHLDGIASEVHLCPIDSPRALPAEALVGHFSQACLHEDFAKAFSAAKASGAPVLIAGSLFLVGEAKEHLEGARRDRSAQ
ncbi:bifunctional folylpolyglutamate synthase/dihydrofolate synthase [Haloferula sp. A504]|uniref:bifunctional folylpolyglutamate synthase/dihydrofolate synthase n=1 Tax=Haloferula sp. A504 TaxID=3373601 RepID=UPI0031CB5E67|nr:bifunctional folylpolyglutamate synthase/dihydrofolate synthase [Verrucomicrobiaceae bacterium E54]